MRRRLSFLALAFAAFALAGTSLVVRAQFDEFDRRGGWDRRSRFDDIDDARNVDRNGVPEWENEESFSHDVFTFVRLRYHSGWRRGGGWRTDFPDSDLNISFRLQQLTSLKVNPHGRILDITNPELFDYPFVYMIEPGGIELDPEEAEALRKYLTNGGFLMIDDFWGDDQWEHFAWQFEQVFDDREWIELDVDHPIFHCVYDLNEKPQIPSITAAQRGRFEGVTWEGGWDGRDVHYRGLFDDDGRLMALACHNTDLGDGWEREGEDPWYFREFSEKKAYPMGINIIFYAMTH